METINENEFFRKCEYRNCNKSLDGRRPNVKYCDRKCKSMESTYVLNKKKLLKKYMEAEMIKIENIKKFKEILKGT